MGGKQILILGEKCDAITLDFGSHYTILYFSNKYRINSSGIRKDGPSFLQYLIACESIPLKIVMSGGGGA
jgi:hypothetical protein